jgi:signal transduction histidine kinase
MSERPQVARRLRDFRTRIALAAVSIAVGVAVPLTLSAIIHDHRSMQQSLLTTGQQLVINLARNTLVSVLAGDRDEAENAAHALTEVPDVAHVLIYRGRELFARADALAAGATSLVAPAAPPEGVTVQRIDEQGRSALSFLCPIVLEPSAVGDLPADGAPQRRQVVGTAEVVLSLDRQAAALRATITRNAIILAIAVGLAQLASMVVARRFARPLKRLMAAAERIGSGELDVTLPVESADEVGKLSETFNRMAADLRQLDESKTKFLALVSHELRTPLVAIRGYLQLARSGSLGSVPTELEEPLAVMDRNAVRLSDHVERLLLFSVMTAGQLPIAKQRCDLRVVLSETVERFRTRLAEGGHPLDVALGDSPLWVLGDPVRLGQVFDNLLSNAIKFSRPGGKVSVRAQAGGERVTVEISDQGIGIPEELHHKIFERFYQIPKVLTRPYSGVGIGLAIVKELVTRHGGSISVESRPGDGSTFRTELPLIERRGSPC